MAILINETKSIFTLQTDHSMYQMKVDQYGVLLTPTMEKKAILLTILI